MLQLFGYYFAALSVDIKPWGRRRMTTFSFLMVRFVYAQVSSAVCVLVQTCVQACCAARLQ